MLKKSLSFRNHILFGLTLLLSPFVIFHAKANVKHNPRKIFERVENSQVAVKFAHSTKASKLHKSGYKGKGTKVAIIDDYFHPHNTAPLIAKGVIDKDALAKGFLISPDEKLELEKVTSNEIYNDFFKTKSSLALSNSALEKEDLQKKKNHLERLYHRKYVFDLYRPGKTAHGSQVMDALHQIAPEATVFPISTSIMTEDSSLSTDEQISHSLTMAIQTAIQHNVNIINLSSSLKYLTDEGIAMIQRAQKKGIAIVCSSGNDSGVDPAFFQRAFDNVKNIFVKSNKMKVFEALDKKGILFSGALEYDKNGYEKVANFTSIPKAKTLSNFIMAPGKDLNLTSELVEGTSFSAPITTGAYLLLTQYVKENKLPYQSPDDLLRILHDSGHDLKHSPWHRFTTDTYKVLNLENAIELAQQRLKPIIKQPIPPTKPTPSPQAHPTKHISAPLKKPAPAPTPPAQLKKLVPASASPAPLKKPMPASASPAQLKKPAPTSASPAQLKKPAPTSASPAQLKKPVPAPTSKKVKGTSLKIKPQPAPAKVSKPIAKTKKISAKKVSTKKVEVKKGKLNKIENKKLAAQKKRLAQAQRVSQAKAKKLAIQKKKLAQAQRVSKAKTKKLSVKVKRTK